MATTVNDARAVAIVETVRTDRNLWRPAIAALLHPGRDVRSGVRGPDTDVDRHVADRPRALMGFNPTDGHPTRPNSNPSAPPGYRDKEPGPYSVQLRRDANG